MEFVDEGEPTVDELRRLAASGFCWPVEDYDLVVAAIAANDLFDLVGEVSKRVSFFTALCQSGQRIASPFTASRSGRRSSGRCRRFGIAGLD
jgi:hypothetical protein